jgi:hypothetical protein
MTHRMGQFLSKELDYCTVRRKDWVANSTLGEEVITFLKN